MDSVTQVIREIVRDELGALRLGELAVVTSVFPVAGPDSPDTYSCSVRLRERDVELRRVPIATPHTGFVGCPEVGDLVLVTFVGGDANAPVVLGRLHSERLRPPPHTVGEVALAAPIAGDTRLSIQPDGAVVARAGDAQLVLRPDGSIAVDGAGLTLTATGELSLAGQGALTLQLAEDAEIEVGGNATIRCGDCRIDASGAVELGAGGAGVITETSHQCYFTGAPLVGSQSVRAKD